MDQIKRDVQEDLWGYAKRIRFVCDTIAEAFPGIDPKDLRVLDIGCGNGSQLTLPLAQQGFQIVGLDLDEPSIDHARMLGTELPNATFRCTPAAELSKEEPFDVVILSETLEHLADPKIILSDAVACLAPSGITIVTVPNGYGEFELDSWIFRALRLQRVVDAIAGAPREVMSSTDNQECGHVQFFTQGKLISLFAACGLVPFRRGTASFLAGPMAGHLLARSEKFIRWNARVTDRLPFVMASGWYFGLRRRQDREAADLG
jgi:2-polyprenyl-3-methyl-5-hydroxy-6-metoxy-1,4-benzoquinol methylase